MTARTISKIGSRLRRTVALAGATVFVVALVSAALAPAWLLASPVLADPGGNGKGNGKGGENGNGGKSGSHGNSGSGGSGSSTSDSDQDQDQEAAAASQGGAVTSEHGAHDFVADE